MPQPWTVELVYTGHTLAPEVRHAGITLFTAEREEDAEWLADLFNRLGTVPPSARPQPKE